jgi:hypothetical protein
MTHHETARRLADRGWSVFPVTPNEKLPAIPAAHPAITRQRRPCQGECGRLGHGVHDATTDGAVIDRWWTHCPHANVGVACGPSSLLVVDLDTPKNGQSPPPAWAEPGIAYGVDVLTLLAERAGEVLPLDTYTVRTGRGGLHLYFHAPSVPTLGNSAGRLGWLIDTRGFGGYVLAEGSVVDGRPYELVHDVEPAALPTWIGQLLAGPVRAHRTPAVIPPPADDRGAGYVRAALRNEIQRVLDAAEGQRNATLNRAAYSLGTLVGAAAVPESLAREALQRAGEAIGLCPREVAATIASGLGAGSLRPRGGGGA